MSLLLALVAIIVPWIAGSLVLRLFWADESPGRRSFIAGYGYVIGLLAAGGLAGLQAGLGLGLGGWPLLLLFVFVIVLLQMRRGGLGLPRVASLKEIFRFEADLSRQSMLAMGVILVLLAIRGLSAAFEMLDQGLYGWDAFTTWAYRARVWVEAGDLLPMVAPEVWLGDRNAALIALPAANYPPLTSLIMAWPATLVGSWDETAALLPWIFLFVALGLGLYGQCRLWGATPLEGLVFVWFLLSLPLTGSQVAIAGYADLWLAATLGFGFMAFMQALKTADRRQALLAALLVLVGVLIKAEGLVWAAFFLPALLAARLSIRGWVVLAGLVALMLVGLAVSGGIVVDLPVLGRLELSLGRVYSPITGEFVFSAQEGVLRPLLIHFFVFDTWHLLMWGIFFGLLWQVAMFVTRDRATSVPQGWQVAALAWVVSAFAGYYLLFFWTAAAEWVRLGTSVNRIVLHFAPALIFWLQCLWVFRRERVALSP